MKKLFLLLFFINSLYSYKLAFLAFVDDKWQVVIYKNGEFKVVKTKKEPRSFDVDFDSDDIVYLGADQNLWLKTKDNEKILIKSKIYSFIEPSFVRQTKDILVTKRRRANPRFTNIALYDRKNSFLIDLYQDACQHYPKSIDKKTIYFTNTICLEGCGGDIIIEVWKKDFITRKAKQLTLFNSDIQEFSLGYQDIYFLSDKSGLNQIYKLNLFDSSVKKVTKDDYSYKYFCVSGGRLFFIKNNQVFYLENNQTKKIDIPKKFKKIRLLRGEA